MMERSKTVANQQAFVSMIVPLSGHSTKRMTPLIANFYERYSSCHLMNTSGDANPSRLFPDVKFRLALFVVSSNGEGMFTSGYTNFYAEERDTLLARCTTRTSETCGMPRQYRRCPVPYTNRS